MSFGGKYGHLSTVEAAKATLMDIAENVDKERFNKLYDPSLSSQEDYDLRRLHRSVYGLQMVLWKNGASVPPTWLPQLFDWKKHRD